MSHKRLKVIDLFAGVGGLSYGFAHDARFRVVAANEAVPVVAKAYRLNNPDILLYMKDIKDFTAKEVRSDLGVENIDIVLGGPPCQAYSGVGTRSLDDPRGQLFWEYLRVLTEFQPRLFIFENVKGLLSMGGGRLVKRIMHLFRTVGYVVGYAPIRPRHPLALLAERQEDMGIRLGARHSRPTHAGCRSAGRRWAGHQFLPACRFQVRSYRDQPAV